MPSGGILVAEFQARALVARVMSGVNVPDGDMFHIRAVVLRVTRRVATVGMV